MASPVGTLMRHWRRERRMSQLTWRRTGPTQRHVSFVESGRAQPSRELLLQLSRALDVPLRERNQLLLAAGYAPPYRETGLDAPGLAAGPARAGPPPRPAGTVSRRRDGSPLGHHRANAAATALFTRLLDGPPPAPANVIRLMFGPLRPHVANFDLTAEALIARIHREAVPAPGSQTRTLLDEASPRATGWRRPTSRAPRPR